ncbi:MAG TPA: hypothetical protein VIJ57_11785, partial [Hanamia sp.]
HIPDILKWGDISLVAALNKRAELIFKNPVSITGKEITGQSLATFKDLFLTMKITCKSDSKIVFTN